MVIVLAPRKCDAVVACNSPVIAGTLAALSSIHFAALRPSTPPVPFTADAATVTASVPADAALVAARDLGRDETLVLAYRTQRALPRESSDGPAPRWMIVPASEIRARSAAGWRVVAESHRSRGGDVALVRTAND